MSNFDPAFIELSKKGYDAFETMYISLDKDKSGNGGKYSKSEAKIAFDFYKSVGKSTSSSFRQSFNNDPFGKGTTSRAVDGLGEAIMGKAGRFGKVLVGVNNLVKGVANLGGKVLDTQMGIDDANSASKIIFDLVKDGGINPLKLLASGGEEVMNQVLGQLKSQSVLLSDIGSKTGLVTELGSRLREDMTEASIEGARYGKSLSEIGDFYTTLVESSGKFSLINQDVYDSAIPLSAMLNMNLSQLASTLSSYENVGVGLNQSIENLEGASNRSLSLGLSANKVTQTMSSEISKLNSYGFEGGVRGLERMVQKSLEFRTSMESVYKLADKVFNPEGALDLVANLQVLGGAIGDFNDPLKLMYMATNDVEGLQDALIGAAESLSTYNEEQGRFEITGVNLRRAKEMAGQLDMTLEDLSKTAIAAAERTSAATALMSTGLIMEEGDREFLTNLSRMEDGEMKIVVPKSLVDEMGGQTEISLSRLTDAQSQILLENREAFKEMDAKDVAMGQLTELQQVSRGIDVIASYARVRAADYLATKAKDLTPPMINELKLEIESFSTQLSQKVNPKQITSSNTSEIRNITSQQLSNTNQPNLNNVQPTPKVIEGKVVHVLQIESKVIMDSVTREAVKNPEMAEKLMKSMTTGDYLQVESNR